jgi:hypothetical protein
MSSPDVRLHPSDAAELGELLQFLDDWLTRDREHRAPSLAEFVGHPGYGIPQLQADLAASVPSSRGTASTSGPARNPNSPPGPRRSQVR